MAQLRRFSKCSTVGILLILLTCNVRINSPLGYNTPLSSVTTLSSKVAPGHDFENLSNSESSDSGSVSADGLDSPTEGFEQFPSTATSPSDIVAGSTATSPSDIVAGSTATSPSDIVAGSTEPSVLSCDRKSSPCTVAFEHKDVIVDCRGKRLVSLCAEWFPHNTTILWLDNNCLEDLSDSVSKTIFQGLSQLRVLSLANNNLFTLDEDMFHGLENLEVLNLEHNDFGTFCNDDDDYDDPNDDEAWLLAEQPCQDKYLLKHLITLREFRINYNYGSVPEEASYNQFIIAIRNLSHLEILTMDVYGTDLEFFNFSVSPMPYLSRLEISLFSDTLSNKSFQGFQSSLLKELIIVNAPSLRTIDEDTFEPLQFLDTLVLSNSIVGLGSCVQALKPFVGTKMLEISFNNVNPNEVAYLTSYCPSNMLDRFPFVEDCNVLRKYRFLPYICAERMSFKSNNIVSILFEYNEGITSFYTCTSFLDLSGNSNLQVHNVPIWNSLVELSVANSKRTWSYGDKDKKFYADSHQGLSTQNPSHSCVPYEFNNVYCISSTTNHLVSSLRVLNKSASVLDVDDRVCNGQVYANASGLQVLDLSRNGYRKVKVGIKGLPNLKRFYFSHNNLTEFTETYFDDMRNVEYIDLSFCQLQDSFLFSNGSRLFANVSKLKEVTLSSNDLKALAKDAFKANSLLEIIDISRNKLSSLSFDVKHTPNLQILNLAHNSLSFLTTEETKALDEHYLKQPNFSLHLEGNLLPCSCENIAFLLWLRSTHISLDKAGNYSCIAKDAVLSFTGDIPYPKILWRQCVGGTSLLISLSLLLSLAVSFLLVVVYFRNRTYVKTFVLRALIPEFRLKTREDYPVDVYIGYADKDYRFPCTTLREYIEDRLALTTYIHDRDQLVDLSMSDAIVRAINSSWRLLLVVTHRFVDDDEWAHFAVKTAVYSVTPANPNRLVVLTTHDVKRRLPVDLLRIVPESNILTVPSFSMTYWLKEQLRTRLCS